MGSKIDSKGTGEDVMGEKTMPVTGGCLCGAIRYESSEPPEFVIYCHCRMCQQALGGLFSLSASFHGEAFRYTQGEPTYYQSSAWAKRGFCANCGSPVDFWNERDNRPFVLIGTLDHPEDWPPDYGHSGIESKVPWHVIADDLPQKRTDEGEFFKAAKASVRDEADRGD